MEGTYSTADDLAIVEALDQTAGTNADHEVYNYIRAIDFGTEQISKLPISHRVIRGMHAVLLERTGRNRGANKRPGEYKIHQNWIGALEIKKARFIPPPPDHAQACMDELERYINSESQGMPPLLAAGISHYQFETIHPFGDGNGRIGRMLITLQLLSHGLLDTPLLYVSPTIEETKDQYIDNMFAVSTKGEWVNWLRYFLCVVRDSCKTTINTITKLNDLQANYRTRIQKNTKSVSAIAIADSLFERPVLSVTEASKISNTSYQAAKKSIDQLVRLKILTPVDGLENPKLYWAKEIINISDGRV